MGPEFGSKTGRRCQHLQTSLGQRYVKGPNVGVDYFKNELWPHFVKGVEAVFIFRFYQLQKFYRGSQDLQRWIDTFHPDPPEHPDFQQALQVENAGLQADGLVAQQQAVQQGFQPQPIVLFTPEEGLQIWNNRRRMVHRDNFPLSDHLFTLMTIVQADLTEQPRDKLTSHLAIRGIPLFKTTH